MAMSDIARFEARGIHLTPREVVRANAFGLKVEVAADGADVRVMPRVAIIGDIGLHEPTIGHEIWMRQAADIFKLDNFETLIKVRAFCLSRMPGELPDVCDRAGVVSAVRKFCRGPIRDYTLAQVASAVTWAETGADPSALEVQPVNERRKLKKDITPGEKCYEMGLMRNGILLNLGSPAALRDLTISDLEILTWNAMAMKFGDEFRSDARADALADYFRVLKEIEKAHTEVKSGE